MSKRLRETNPWITEWKLEKEHPENAEKDLQERLAELRRIREEKNKNMTRAEQAAVEKYPHGTFDGELGDSLRAACAVGYMQAQKDLADAFQSEYAKELARADAQAEKDLALTIDAARELVESVEKYIRQEELRSQLLIKKETLKKLL